MKEKKNYWVAGLILLAVIFGLMSAWSFYRAGSEVSSVVDPDYYNRGIRYDESQNSLKEAEEMGLNVAVEVEGHLFLVDLSAADTSPVTGFRGHISLQHARGATTPSSFALHEEAPGVYSAELPPDLAGTVPARLSLSRDNLLVERQLLLYIRRD
ncbi:MAG: FixH family protein [Desulfobulbales bacterium]|nr:FixH family protein [Desulfobulbales bacterium]